MGYLKFFFFNFLVFPPSFEDISKLSSFLYFYFYKNCRDETVGLYGGAMLGSKAHPYKCTVALLTSGYIAYELVNEETDSFALYKGEGACSLGAHA